MPLGRSFVPVFKYDKLLSHQNPHLAKEEVDHDQLNRIEEKLDRLHHRLDLLFGKEVLIDGKWVNLEKFGAKKPKRPHSHAGRPLPHRGNQKDPADASTPDKVPFGG